MISVTMVETDCYRVDIEGNTQHSFNVHMSTDCYRALSNFGFTHEWTVVQVCHVLMTQDGSDTFGMDIDLDALIEREPRIAEEVRTRLHNREH